MKAFIVACTQPLVLVRQRALGGGHRIADPRIAGKRCPEHPRHRLETGFGDMVIVASGKIDDMQGQSGILRHGLEEFTEQLGIEIADLRLGKISLPDQEWPARSRASRITRSDSAPLRRSSTGSVASAQA